MAIVMQPNDAVAGDAGAFQPDINLAGPQQVDLANRFRGLDANVVKLLFVQCRKIHPSWLFVAQKRRTGQATLCKT